MPRRSACSRRSKRRAGCRVERYDYFPGASQLQAGQPLSRTIFHLPSDSRRQTELNVPVRLPDGSRTGPEDMASLPESRTSTNSGAQENGACAALEEGLPAFGNLLRAARRLAAGHEDGLGGEEGRKGGRVAVGHGFGEGNFGLTHLLLELRVRLGGRGGGQE